MAMTGDTAGCGGDVPVGFAYLNCFWEYFDLAAFGGFR
jgi:hypothetical protein